ncbi:hypothetical protein IFT98_02770 [Pseudomonas sp. CFBP 8770]|uniref:hypothetical protein n=1 Tax=unclassified Pseudomonas TaxID=196821 RepID=UPI0017872999|nr:MULTISPECIES: hypothetical protein [unclassified Pseudomonas]MBD8472993.1 hypothetical protein [Pseudomonas sp. CFBP 8773]MBD8645904.1 hypothetical protein [Pseudomonas sp. CFBP 8770]
MSIRVDLLGLEPAVPGQACLTVKKWQGSHERLEFSIQRNQDGFYLQEHKQWSSNPFWFKVPHFSEGASGESLETLVGPDVVDPLLEGSANSNFQIELREQGLSFSDRGVVRPGAGLLASSAGGETRGIYGGIDLATPTVPSEPLDIPAVPVTVTPTTPEVEPRSEPIQSKTVERPAVALPPQKSRLLPIILGLLVLILAAAGFWFFLNGKTQAPATPEVTVEPARPSAVAACTLESMNSQPELAFVQACIKQAPASAELLKIIETAKASKHCGIAQRLYANRSQAGDLLIATAYAHEYDPKYHQPSDCFAEPDKATAAYWYETILGLKPNNADAKQRFEELKP